MVLDKLLITGCSHNNCILNKRTLFGECENPQRNSIDVIFSLVRRSLDRFWRKQRNEYKCTHYCWGKMFTNVSAGGGALVTRSCPTLAIPWTVPRQASLSMGFSRQEYWSGLPFPSPGDLPNPGIESMSPVSPALQADSFNAEPSGKHWISLQTTF